MTYTSASDPDSYVHTSVGDSDSYVHTSQLVQRIEFSQAFRTDNGTLRAIIRLGYYADISLGGAAACRALAEAASDAAAAMDRLETDPAELVIVAEKAQVA